MSTVIDTPEFSIIQAKHMQNAHSHAQGFLSQRIEKLAFCPPSLNNVQNVHNLMFIKRAKTNENIPALFIDRSSTRPNTRAALEERAVLPLIIFSHGNAENLGSIEPWLETVSQTLDCDVLAYEYGGYGISSAVDRNACSENDMCERAQAAYEWAVYTRGVAPEKVYLFGFSIGTVPSIYLASRKDVRIGGIIIQGPFLSACSIVTDAFSECIAQLLRIFTERFDFMKNHERLLGIDPSTRVLVIHGQRDPIVPFSHAERIVDILGDNNKTHTIWFPDGEHEDLHNRAWFEHTYYNGIREFLLQDTM